MEVALIAALFGAAVYTRKDANSSLEEKPTISPITAQAAVQKSQTPPVGADVSKQVGVQAPPAAGNSSTTTATSSGAMFGPREFGELSFKEFVMGGGGELSAPDPKPEQAGWRTQPYFRSEKTQGFNPRTAQFKTELFTGTTNMAYSRTGTYKHHTESVERFQPGESAARVNYYGKAGQPVVDAEEQRKKYRASARMNNALPFEQIRVGPGLGVGANVAAEGGLHPYLRVVPHAVGDYKKNSLPGRIAPGRTLVDSGEAHFFEAIKKLPPRYYSQEQHPTMATGDPTEGTRGPMERPAEPRYPFITRDQVHPGDLRCPRLPDPSQMKPCGYGDASLNRTLAGIRGGSAAVGVDSFGDPSARSENNRTADYGGRIGAGELFGVVGQTGPGIGAENFTVEDGRFEKLTRESSKPFSDFVRNQASSSRALGTTVSGAYQYNAPGNTIRDVTGARGFEPGPAAQFAPRGGAVEAPEIQKTFLQLDRHAKRGDQVRGYTPPAAMTRADATAYGAVGIKDSREAGGRIQGPAEIQIANPGFDEAERGLDTRARKTDPSNVRLWNDLAAGQLKMNEWAKTIAEL
jgi:hypothetical protein